MAFSENVSKYLSSVATTGAMSTIDWAFQRGLAMSVAHLQRDHLLSIKSDNNFHNLASAITKRFSSQTSPRPMHSRTIILTPAFPNLNVLNVFDPGSLGTDPTVPLLNSPFMNCSGGAVVGRNSTFPIQNDRAPCAVVSTAQDVLFHGGAVEGAHDCPPERASEVDFGRVLGYDADLVEGGLESSVEAHYFAQCALEGTPSFGAVGTVNAVVCDEGQWCHLLDTVHEVSCSFQLD